MMQFVSCYCAAGSGGSSASVKEVSSDKNTQVTQPAAAAPGKNDSSV